MTIYTITLVEEIPSYDNILSKNEKRTVGFFDSLEKAQKAIEENNCDYYEHRWFYLVIEMYKEGSWVYSIYEWWYYWDHLENKYKFTNKPTCFIGIKCFAMG